MKTGIKRPERAQTDDAGIVVVTILACIFGSLAAVTGVAHWKKYSEEAEQHQMLLRQETPLWVENGGPFKVAPR